MKALTLSISAETCDFVVLVVVAMYYIVPDA